MNKKVATTAFILSALLLTGIALAQPESEIEEEIEEGTEFDMSCTVIGLDQPYVFCMFPLTALEEEEEDDLEQEEIMEELSQFIEQQMTENNNDNNENTNNSNNNADENNSEENNEENENNEDNEEEGETPPWIED